MRYALWLALAGCSLDAGSTAQPISHPTQVGAHPSTGRLTITGPNDHFEGCHFTLIAPRWALTAAHCFLDVEPFNATLTVGGLNVSPSEVHFHPETFNGTTEWTTEVFGPDDVHDLALVHLPGSTGLQTAKLWNPPNIFGALDAGDLITITGSNNGFLESNQDAIGTAAFLQLHDYGNGWMIEADDAPSGLQPGDSGGGAFVTASTAPMPYSDPCARAPAAQNEEALIGVNKRGGSFYDIVPIYIPSISSWINSFTNNDTDDDHACDGADNCPDIPNGDQANANATAETAPAWGGNVLGDMCDPTPAAPPELVETSFVTATSGFPKPGDGVLITTHYGRSIRDRLELTPVLADGSSTSSSVQVRFCVCGDAAGNPLPLDTCKAAPYYCKLDPAQISKTEVGGGVAPTASQTYWHKLTLNTGVGAAVSLAYPGAVVARTWKYKTDFQTWLANGWVTQPAPDPTYGAGTDLAGWMWIHDSTGKGFSAHGGAANPADTFAPLAPDPKSTTTTAKRIPRYKPNPWWSYCAMCGDMWKLPGEDVVDPAPFVTLDATLQAAFAWDEHGGFDASAYVSPTLRRVALDSSMLLVGPSEPLAVTRSHALPRQIVLAADGSAVLGTVARGLRQFDVVSLSDRGPTARRGFATAWSRTAGALFVVGGIDAAGAPLADAWTWRPGARFTRVAIDRRYAPTATEAAVYSPRDARMWIVDRMATGARRLIRLDPLTGVVESVGDLPLGADLESVYLTTTPEGTVVLAGGIGARYRIVRLSVQPFSPGARVVAAASADGSGTLLGPPVVANGKLDLAISVTVGETSWIESRAVALP